MAEAKAVAKLESVKPLGGKQSEETLATKFEQRRSKYLVLGFCGSVGCGSKHVIEEVAQTLKSHYGYDVEMIKISDFIKKYGEKLKIEGYDKAKLPKPADRYSVLQDTGNASRKEHGNPILGELAVQDISRRRSVRIKEEKGLKGEDFQESDIKSSQRIAYLIDSLKHPDEVSVLRAVYRNMFYLFGILSAYPIRQRRLAKEGIAPADVEAIITRDKQEKESFGQHLIKTLQYADFFIRNDRQNVTNIHDQLTRYFDLVLGTGIVTPTRDEYAMYIAQSAALRSACLSKQVGAVIVNQQGDIISTGCNDVPKAGGGLYCCEDGHKDMRCGYMEGQMCHNVEHKQKIKKEIEMIVKDMIKDKEETEKLVEALSDRISRETRLKDLIEFSRAVHAEMDAIVSAARNGSASIKGATLFTTTFPCHACTRHIVAAGIKKVFYIEPYEKSLALELHSDAIEIEPSFGESDGDKVLFQHFEGVAPRQYLSLFFSKDERKEEGKAVSNTPNEAMPSVPEYLDSWVDFEAKVVQHLRDFGVSKT